jgi:hypothetical protein
MKQQAEMAGEEFEGVPVGKGRYRVKLSNCGNPDFRQDCRRALPDTFCGWARVESLGGGCDPLPGVSLLLRVGGRELDGGRGGRFGARGADCGAGEL